MNKTGSERGASLWTARGSTPLFPSSRVRRANSPLPRQATQRLASARRTRRLRPPLLRKAQAGSSPRSEKPRGTHTPPGFGWQPAFGLPLNHAPRRLDPRRRLAQRRQGSHCGAALAYRRLRGGECHLPLQRGRSISRADRGLQGRDPVARRPRIWSQRRGLNP